MINLNAMLTCASTANSPATKPEQRIKKPMMFQLEPVIVTAPIPNSSAQNSKPAKVKHWFDVPLKDEPLTIDGKEYKNVDDFLDHIKTSKRVNTKDLRPGMKTEIVELYKLALENGFKFRIFCGVRTKEQNDDNYDRSIENGREGYVAKNSLHKKGKGLAVDIKTDELTAKQKYILGKLWKRRGHPWGGDLDPQELFHFPMFLNTKEGVPIDENGHRIILNS